MTLGQALNDARRRLAKITPEAFLEAELLLRHVTGYSRERLFASLDEEIASSTLSRLRGLLSRRLRREPLAYILRSREFYGLDFYVDRRVLIPRPETELLVEAVLGRARGLHRPLIADVGTGSGAVAISLAVHLPRAEIFATDISRDALEVAGLNRRRHNVEDRVRLLHGDLLAPLPVPVDIIAFNPPYIPSGEFEALPPEVRDFEPREALDGGGDGLEVVRRFLTQVPEKLLPGGCFFLEIGAGQAPQAAELILRRFPEAEIEILNDPAGIPRIIGAAMTTAAVSDKIIQQEENSILPL